MHPSGWKHTLDLSIGGVLGLVGFLGAVTELSKYRKEHRKATGRDLSALGAGITLSVLTLGLFLADQLVPFHGDARSAVRGMVIGLATFSSFVVFASIGDVMRYQDVSRLRNLAKATAPMLVLMAGLATTAINLILAIRGK